MAFVAALRRVLANLQQGRPAEAVRTDEPAVAGAAFRRRAQAQAATDAWLQALLPTLPALPDHLHAALQQATALHDDDPPVTSLPALRQALAAQRDGLQAGLDRAGLVRTAAEQALLDNLAELQARLTAD